jgi:hypothetical protein
MREAERGDKRSEVGVSRCHRAYHPPVYGLLLQNIGQGKA